MYTKFHEIELDKPTWAVALLATVEQKETKSKQPFCVFTLQDGEKTIQANIWNTQKENVKLEQGLISVQLYKKIYNGTESWEVKAYDAAPLDAKMEDFIITAPIPSIQMLQEILAILTKEIGITGLCRLAVDFLARNKEKLFYWSAAKMIHHNCYGGLLYHLYRMTRMGLVLLKVYPLYKDVLITGIILHDIGKLKELKTSPLGAADFTADGNLFGHVFLGLEMFDEAVSEVKKEFDSISEDDAEKIRLVKHLIASHHGKTEYGAIATPAIPEAMVLNYLDLIDSRMDIYEKNKPSEAGTISERIWSLDGFIYSHALSLPENKNQK